MVSFIDGAITSMPGELDSVTFFHVKPFFPQKGKECPILSALYGPAEGLNQGCAVKVALICGTPAPFVTKVGRRVVKARGAQEEEKSPKFKATECHSGKT